MVWSGKLEASPTIPDSREVGFLEVRPYAACFSLFWH
jgi:hypothetical protein